MPTKDHGTNNTNISVLIVAKSDRSRHSLKFLLEINSKIKVIGQASKSLLATQLVRQHRPALMILDTNLPPSGAWVTLLKQVKAESPQTRCLVLTGPTHEVQVPNADAVLIKGFLLATLFATIEKMFPDKMRML